jgi:hypothetical protein
MDLSHLLTMPEGWMLTAAALWNRVCTPGFSWWLLARWSFQSLSLSLLVFASDFLFGALLLRYLAKIAKDYVPPALRAAASLALGSGLAGWFLFLAGFVHGIRFPVVLGLTVAMGVIGAAGLVRLRALPWAFSFVRGLRPSRLGLVLALACLPLFLLHVFDLLMPVLEFDSRLYHMSTARLYLDTGGVPYHGEIRFNAQPHLTSMIYLRHWILLGDEGLLKLVNLEFALILLLLVLYAAREMRAKHLGVPAALFLAASPVFCFVSKSEYADFIMAAFLGTGAALLFHTIRRRRTGWPLAAALLIGMAAASKVQGLVMAAALMAGLMAACLAARRRTGWTLGSLLAIGGGVVLCGIPWWIRSWVHTGSPLYPFFLPGDPETAALFRISASYGLGRGFTDFLLLPWRMATALPSSFGDSYIFGVPGPLLIGLLLLVVLRRRRWPPETLLLTTMAGLFTLFWFWTGQQMRYLSSLLPLLALLFVWALASLGAGRRVAILLILTLGFFAARGALETSPSCRLGSPPPIRYADREIMLASVFPYYRAARELNQAASPRDRTYLLFSEECRFHVLGVSYGDWLGDLNYTWLAQNVHSLEQLLARLRRSGFQYIVVGHARATAQSALFGDWFATSGFARPYTPIPGTLQVYADDQFAVLRLLP